MQSINSIGIYAHGTSKDLTCKKGKIKCISTIKQYKNVYLRLYYRRRYKNHEPDIDKVYLYAKGPYEEKYQLLINKRESIGSKYLNDSKAFIEYLMIWMIFLKILKNTIQIKNKKY